jgi:carbon monoxide dehydrogenase subunit G
MPGAELTEVIDEASYKGKISVRLGPVALTFNGTARFEEIDEAGYRARVKASGRDSKGRGGADATVEFHLEPDGSVTKVLIHTDLQLSGSVAQYGRGAAMISALATQLIGQFADCLKLTLAKREGADAALPEPAPARPISAAGLGFRVLWEVIRGAIRRLFGRH